MLLLLAIGLLSCCLVTTECWSLTHDTEDGEVKAYVSKGDPTHWLARVVAREIDSGRTFTSSREAIRWCEEAFTRMFPEHTCGARCR